MFQVDFNPLKSTFQVHVDMELEEFVGRRGLFPDWQTPKAKMLRGKVIIPFAVKDFCITRLRHARLMPPSARAIRFSPLLGVIEFERTRGSFVRRSM